MIGIFGTAKTSFNDGEASLHKHDEEAADQCPGEVDTDAVLPNLIDQISEGNAFVGISLDDIVGCSGFGSAFGSIFCERY